MAEAEIRLPTREDGEQGMLTDPTKRKKTIDSPYVRRLQRRHFVLFDVLPLVGTISAIALAATVAPIGVVEVALFSVMYLLTALGISVGFHRLFTHRSFKAHPAARAILHVLGCMAGQGSMISWVAIHRRHHEFSDLPGDPHSPNLHGTGWRHSLRGLAHSHFAWMTGHEYPSVVHYAPDHIRSSLALKLDRFYFVWVLLGLLAPAAAGGWIHGTWIGALNGLLWGGVVRLFVLEHVIWSINSFLHKFGPRRFPTREDSRNNAAMSLLSVGESWHNNHHAFPASAHFGLDWYRPDVGYWTIKALEQLGLASDIRVPSRARIESAMQGKG